MCDSIGVPIAIEKTEWASEWVIFLGILLDGKDMVLRLPMEKCDKAVKMLHNFKEKCKTTIKELQELCGYLNFICKAIFPGRTFLMRMYAKYSKYVKIPSHRREVKDYHMFMPQLKAPHHVRLDKEFREDCKIWLQFLDTSSNLYKVVNWPMIDILEPALTSVEICFYSDASAAEDLGFGCIFNKRWIQGCWKDHGNFIRDCEPSIEYLELFAMVAGVLTWQNLLTNCRITIFCDNKAILSMVNKLSSSCKNCMVLLRLLTLNNLTEG